MYMPTKWDPSNLRLSPDYVSEVKPKRKKKRVKGRFLRGPIPMNWIAQAHKCGGKAGLMGNILWHLAGMNKNARAVTVTNVEVARWGLNRYAKRRALNALAGAELITIERSGKRSPLVTILDGPAEGE
jgi:hypothetical protein